MTLREVFIGDTDLGRYGFSLIPDLEGWRDAAVGSRPSAPAPGLAGRILLDGRPDIPARQVTIQGFLRASSLATLLEYHRQLKAICCGGRVELRLADDPDRQLVCELPEARFPGLPPRLVNKEARLTLRFEALDPYWYDRNPTVVSGPSATRIACPLGTAPIAPVLLVIGAVTNPAITLRNHAGDVVSTLTWTGTLAATDYLEVDVGARTAKKVASGVITDAAGTLSGDLPVLTPDHGHYAAGSWPTLEVSGTTAALRAEYWRGWL